MKLDDIYMGCTQLDHGNMYVCARPPIRKMTSTDQRLLIQCISSQNAYTKTQTSRSRNTLTSHRQFCGGNIKNRRSHQGTKEKEKEKITQQQQIPVWS
jgi:hypothetical protein